MIAKNKLYNTSKRIILFVTISSGLGLKGKNAKGQFSARGLSVLSYLSLMQLRYNNIHLSGTVLIVVQLILMVPDFLRVG